MAVVVQLRWDGVTPDLYEKTREIVQWETGLATEGAILVKVWLHISEEEQLRRFRARFRTRRLPSGS